jgi:hypothetical protein
MRYNNRLFPHPVLGIEDDVSGEFSAELTYRSDKDFITLSPTFKLLEEVLRQFIDDGKAHFLIQVYCSSTMYREVFKTKSVLPEPITIPSLRLRGDVEVHFFICAFNTIDKFFSKNFNTEYNNFHFAIDRSDILAYGGKAKFTANKSPEELKSVSSLIRVRNSQKVTHPMWNEYDGEKIDIMLCEDDYNNYQLVLKNRIFHNLLHCSIVLPALVDALYFIDTNEAKDFEDRRWFKALKEIKSNSKVADCFRIAQNILDQPSDRTFGTMLTLMEETNIIV